MKGCFDYDITEYYLVNNNVNLMICFVYDIIVIYFDVEKFISR